MSMTQKEIKDLISDKESDIEDLKSGYKKFDEYEKLQEELNELLKRKAQIEKEQAEIRVEYQRETQDEMRIYKDDLAYYKELFRKAQSGLNPDDYSDTLKQMFKLFHRGTSYSQFKKLTWVSEGGKYAIFKVNAHAAYIGRFSGSVSANSMFCLMHIDERFAKGATMHGGIDASSECCLWVKEGGRWGSKKHMKIVEKVIDNYENNTFMKEWMEENGFKWKFSRVDKGWYNEDIVIKYTTSHTPKIGFIKGKTIVEEHERVLYFYYSPNSYYIDMPNSEEELQEMHPSFYEEWLENK